MKWDYYPELRGAVWVAANIAVKDGKEIELDSYFETPPDDFRGDSAISAEVAHVLAPYWPGGDVPQHVYGDVLDVLGATGVFDIRGMSPLLRDEAIRKGCLIPVPRTGTANRAP